MIQFNLLPDVKLDYIKAKKTKQRVLSISFLVTAASFGMMILLFLVVNVAQRNHSNNLTNDINRLSKELQETEGLDKVLTVQNQLNRITALHDAKPVTTRLAKYITQITPAEVTIADLTVDFSANTIAIQGATDNLKTINKFVDTLKFTDFKTESGTQAKAFSNVVLKTFGRDDEGANFEINLSFDQAIFNSAEAVELIVPNTVTTRSVIEKPGPLFQPLPDGASGEEITQ